MFDFKRKEEILRLLRKRHAKKVFVQVPEGLKTGILKLVDFLDKKGIRTFLSVEPCFGACDLRDREAGALGCDLLLHIGHKDFGVSTEVPVVYYEYFMDFDFVPLLRKVVGKLKFRKLCLVTTIQFVKNLKPAKAFLEKRGFNVCIGGGVLGCDVSWDKCCGKNTEAFLFIGSGRFHPLGLQEKVEKPVLFLDIEKHMLEDLSREKNHYEVKRQMRIQKAKDLKNFGVVVSSKPGQLHLKAAENIRNELKRMGKKVYIIVSDQLTPEKLLGMKIDVLVNTACPRIREDCEMFGKVILNPEDAYSL